MISYPVFTNTKVLYFRFEKVQVFLERPNGCIEIVERFDPQNILQVGMTDGRTGRKILKILRP